MKEIPTYQVIDRFKKEVVDRGLTLLEAMVYMESNPTRYYIEEEKNDDR